VRPVGKDEHVPAQGVLLQNPLHVGVQSVETLAHIHRIQPYKNPGRRRYAQHPRARSRRINNAEGSASRLRTVKPLGLTTSIAQPGSACKLGALSLNSLKTIGEGITAKALRFSLVNQ
jgi:hypothetical protein